MIRPILAFSCIAALIGATPLAKKAVPVKDIKSRIINGENARLGQFPWQVALYEDTFDGTYFCGGSIISSRWILTAAHCVEDAIEFAVIAGSITSNGDGESSQLVRTYDFIQHENYNPRTLANDVGLLRVDPWNLNNNVQIIALTQLAPIPGDVLSVSGWGLTSDDENTISPILKFVEVVLISHSDCEDIYGQLADSIICTLSGTTVHKATCSGDSGGPLVSDPSGFPRLVGAVSFGADDGCDLGFPDGYSSVERLLGWIGENTNIDVNK